MTPIFTDEDQKFIDSLIGGAKFGDTPHPPKPEEPFREVRRQAFAELATFTELCVKLMPIRPLLALLNNKLHQKQKAELLEGCVISDTLKEYTEKECNILFIYNEYLTDQQSIDLFDLAARRAYLPFKMRDMLDDWSTFPVGAYLPNITISRGIER